jgi:hypothetical protein
MYGPFQYDHTNGGLTTLASKKIPSEWRIQGRYTSEKKDTPFSHSYVEGTLSPWDGTRILTPEPYEETEHYGETEVFLKVTCSALCTADEDKRETDYLKRFEFGGYGIVDTLPPLMVDYEYQQSVNGLLSYLYIMAGGQALTVGFDSEGNHTYLESYTINVEDNFVLSPEGEGTFVISHEVLYEGEEFAWEDDALFAFIPIEQVVLADLRDPETVQHAITLDFCALAKELIGECKSSKPEFGDFLSARSALEAFRILNLNGISFFAELASLKDFLDPVIKLLRQPWCVKHWSQLILWLKYGVKLSFQDYAAIAAAVVKMKGLCKSLLDYRKKRQALQTRYGTFSQNFEVYHGENLVMMGNHRSNARVAGNPVVPKEVDDLRMLLEDFGLRFTWSNIWDYLPWSFVVDWFANVSELCSSCDWGTEISRFRLREFIYSSRNRMSVLRYALVERDFPFHGDLALVTYDREVRFVFPHPPFRLGAPSFIRHWWEGVVIILTKTK